jgi:regulator of sigma E protease
LSWFLQFWQSSVIQDVWWVLVLLGVMIVIHELGHYWAAISVGVRVETFSIGFGPRLFGWHRGSTDFRVSAIPFGGYVRMLGEQPGDENSTDQPDSFQAKKRWQRAVIVIAGPLMNILLAICIMTGVYMKEFPKQEAVHSPVIGEVVPHSPAATAGLESGDRVVQIGNVQNPTWQDIQTKEALNAGRQLPVVVERNGKQIAYTVVPARDKDGIGTAGWLVEADVIVSQVDPRLGAKEAGLKPDDVLISAEGQQIHSMLKLQEIIQKSNGKPVSLTVSRDERPIHFSVVPQKSQDGMWPIGVLLGAKFKLVPLPFGEALIQSVQWSRSNVSMIFDALKSIVQQQISARTLSGPIGIARMSGEAANQGAVVFLTLMAVVSLNLAIFNLLPIPILDGGTLLLLLIEMGIRRDVSMQVKEAVFKVGFVFIMMILVFVIYNDISKIFSNG